MLVVFILCPTVFHIFEIILHVNNGYIARIYVNDCANILSVGISNLLNHSSAIVAHFDYIQFFIIINYSLLHTCA